ncbi:MAG: DNA polymerase [Polyangiales bacterium]
MLVEGRPLPPYGIDLYAEHRLLTNGIECGNRLIDAANFWGVDCMESMYKDQWHKRFIETEPPFPQEWKEGALDYNFEDVEVTTRLLEVMASRIDLGHALIRGAYMLALAEIEHLGFPVDVPLYLWMQEHWDEIKQRMIDACPYAVFEGLSFNHEKFERFLEEELGVTSWKRTPSGRLLLQSRYFAQMAYEYPQLEGIHRIKRQLDTFDTFTLGIDVKDARNRAAWWPFKSKTGRNQPKALNVFSNHSRYVRGLGTPPPGRALCELDYEQQEFAIVAALSEDPRMIESYLSGDPYMALAVLAGAAPPDATKKTHKLVRDRYKVTALAVQFGSTGAGIARRLGEPHAEGAILLRQYDETYEVFREWQRLKRANARYGEPMVLSHGWRLFGGEDIGWRTIDNFWAQGSGSEMLRSAVVKIRQAGIDIVALVHDAIIIEAEVDDIEDAAATAARIMGDVSEKILLGRLRLRTEAKFVGPSDRLLCEEAMSMWNLVTGPYFAELSGNGIRPAARIPGRFSANLGSPQCEPQDVSVRTPFATG